MKLTSGESIYLQTKRMPQPQLKPAPNFYERLKANVPRESFLIGDGMGHGLAATYPVGEFIAATNFTKAALIKGLGSAATNALATAAYYKGDVSKIDFADFAVTSTSEFFTNPLLKAAYKVGLSSTLDLNYKNNSETFVFKNSFDGSKTADNTLIDFAANTALYNNPLKINNELGSNPQQSLGSAE